MTPLGLIAYDGADDDGGTLYALLDDGRPIASASWPHPLIARAGELGRTVERLPAWGGQLDDIRTPRRRRTMTEIDTDQLDELEHADPCKVDGCDGISVARMGPYGGLCASCKADRQATRPAGRGRQAVALVAVQVDEQPVEELPSWDEALQALTATRDLIRELERHIAEERENVARILGELQTIAQGGVS